MKSPLTILLIFTLLLVSLPSLAQLISGDFKGAAPIYDFDVNGNGSKICFNTTIPGGYGMGGFIMDVATRNTKTIKSESVVARMSFISDSQVIFTLGRSLVMCNVANPETESKIASLPGDIFTTINMAVNRASQLIYIQADVLDTIRNKSTSAIYVYDFGGKLKNTYSMNSELMMLSFSGFDDGLAFCQLDTAAQKASLMRINSAGQMWNYGSKLPWKAFSVQWYSKSKQIVFTNSQGIFVCDTTNYTPRQIYKLSEQEPLNKLVVSQLGMIYFNTLFGYRNNLTVIDIEGRKVDEIDMKIKR